MIQLDRTSGLPITEQLVKQLRFAIASGRHRPGERMPSTRGLADQLSISFHTVRKAYQTLEREGVLEARKGSGFRVLGTRPLSEAERMERGAAVVQEALQRLTGLGMNDEEVEYLVQEQLQFFDGGGTRRKVVFAAAYRERAEQAAQALEGSLGESVQGVALSDLGRHADADLVVAPIPHLIEAVRLTPLAQHAGLTVRPKADVLDRVARLGPSGTVGLVTRYPESVEFVLSELRQHSGFKGQAMAVSIAQGLDAGELKALLSRVDLVVYAPSVRRRIRPLLGDNPALALEIVFGEDSLQGLRTEHGV